MYKSFFGLMDTPFNMTPDPRYFFLSDSHREALSALLYGIREDKGLLTLTGPVGVGKTTVLFSFFKRISRNAEIAFFPGGIAGSRVDFFRELCKQFHLRSDHESLFDLTRELKDFARCRMEEGKDVIVLVDEAQDLGVDELNHFRYMNNLETPNAKFLQIILTGSEGLEEKLRDEKLSSLRQRIAIRCVIHPLDPESSIEYIFHRLRVAGNAADNLFTVGALWRIVNHTRGIPRLINVVCDNAMIIAYALRKAPVEESFVVEAIQGLGGDAVEKQPAEMARREEIESLCYSVSRRLQEKASRQGVSVGVGRAAEAQAQGRPPGKEPAETGDALESRPAFVPRKVSVPLDRAARRERVGSWRRYGVAGGVISVVVTLGAVLLHLFAGRDLPVETVPLPPRHSEAAVVEEVALPPPEPPAVEAAAPSPSEPPAPENTGPVDATAPLPDATAAGETSGGPVMENAGEKQAVKFSGKGIGAIALERFGTLNLEILQGLGDLNPGIQDWNRLGESVELVMVDKDLVPTGGVDFYSVQVVSYRFKSNIRNVAERLCRRGLENVFVLLPDSRAGSDEEWSICCVGVFPSSEAAREWCRRMRDAGFRDAFVIRIRERLLQDILYPCGESR